MSVALFGLAFASARLHKLNLARHQQLAGPLCKKYAVTVSKILLRPLVSVWFQVLFHSPCGVLFTFPSRYWSTIGHRQYLALRGGPRGFNPGFTCPDLLR